MAISIIAGQERRAASFLDSERARVQDDSSDSRRIRRMLDSEESSIMSFLRSQKKRANRIEAKSMDARGPHELSRAVNCCIRKVNKLQDRVIDFTNEIDIAKGLGKRGYLGHHGTLCLD